MPRRAQSLYSPDGQPFLVPVSSGILDPKHVCNFSSPLLLYLALVNAQTDDEGTVLHGRELTLEELAGWMLTTPRTVARWLSQLKSDGREVDGESAEPYIALEQGKRGLRIRVLRAKPKRIKTRQICPPSEPRVDNSVHPRVDNSVHPKGPPLLKTLHKTLPCNTGEQLALGEQLQHPHPNGSPDPSEQRMEELMDRYDEGGLRALALGFERCRGVRKSGTIADSVIIRILEQLDRHDVSDVLEGTEAFVTHRGDLGSPERYWLGCIRGARDRRKG